MRTCALSPTVLSPTQPAEGHTRSQPVPVAPQRLNSTCPRCWAPACSASEPSVPARKRPGIWADICAAGARTRPPVAS